MTKMIEKSITTSDLTHRLFRKFDTNEDAITNKYIVATQVRPLGSHGDTTADAVIVGNWPSAGYEIQGFEIKVSRSDWLNEVKHPTKNDMTKQFCDRWWLLIASETMLKEGELPDDWGLMVAHGKGIRIVKEAPKLDAKPADARFISGLMRANKRECITDDLHRQYLNDQKREVEALYKKENDDLREFVKFINEAFGIQLKQNKQWDYKTRKDIKYWVAKRRGHYREYKAEELKLLLESLVSGDMHKAKNDLRNALMDVEEAAAILKKYKDAKYFEDSSL